MDVSDSPYRKGPSFELEAAELQLGRGPIAGVDEAGRGPWAGPVVAAAVILDPENIPAGLNTARDLATLGAKAISARVAERGDHPEEAIALWREAVAMEDKLAYSEPADWFYPLRHFLGAALLDGHRGAEAEAVFRRDLEKNPHNGWALFGLWQALKEQKKQPEAAEAERVFQTAWSRSDLRLARSAF